MSLVNKSIEVDSEEDIAKTLKMNMLLTENVSEDAEHISKNDIINILKRNTMMKSFYNVIHNEQNSKNILIVEIKDKVLELMKKKTNLINNRLSEFYNNRSDTDFTAEELEEIYFSKILLSEYLECIYQVSKVVDLNKNKKENKFLYNEHIKKLNKINLTIYQLKNNRICLIDKREQDLFELFKKEGFHSNISNEINSMRLINEYKDVFINKYNSSIDEFDELCLKILSMRNTEYLFKRFLTINFELKIKRKFYEIEEGESCLIFKQTPQKSVEYLDMLPTNINQRIFNEIMNELSVYKFQISKKNRKSFKIEFKTEAEKNKKKDLIFESVKLTNSIWSRSLGEMKGDKINSYKIGSLQHIFKEKKDELRMLYLNMELNEINEIKKQIEYKKKKI